MIQLKHLKFFLIIFSYQFIKEEVDDKILEYPIKKHYKAIYVLELKVSTHLI